MTSSTRGRARPAGEQLAQDAGRRRLADGDRAGDADDERGALGGLPEEGPSSRRAGPRCPRRRASSSRDSGRKTSSTSCEVDPVAEAAQVADEVLLGEGQRRRGRAASAPGPSGRAPRRATRRGGPRRWALWPSPRGSPRRRPGGTSPAGIVALGTVALCPSRAGRSRAPDRVSSRSHPLTCPSPATGPSVSTPASSRVSVDDARNAAAQDAGHRRRRGAAAARLACVAGTTREAPAAGLRLNVVVVMRPACAAPSREGIRPWLWIRLKDVVRLVVVARPWPARGPFLHAGAGRPAAAG